MKNFLLLFLLISPLYCQAQSNIWTGNANTSDWNNPANWSLLTVPGVSSTVSIGKLINKPYPALGGNTEIAYLDMYYNGGGGSLYISGYELKTGTVWVAGSNIYSNGGTLRTSMIRKCDGMNFYGKLTIYTDNGIEQGNTYHGDLIVYVNPNVPAIYGNNYGECWPCGGMAFAYGEGDTFKGRVVITNTSNRGSLSFGIFDSPRPTVFEKSAVISSLNSKSTCLGINSYGGTTIFQDSVTFNFVETGPNATAYFRSIIDFQGPVKFNQQGGLIQFAASERNQAARIRVRKGFTVVSTGGQLTLGGLDRNVYSTMTFDSSASLHFENFTGGNVAFRSTIINIPNSDIIVPTHPNTPITGGTINFEDALINGKIRVKADQINIKNTTFNGNAIINKDGYAGNPSTYGGNTFNKTVELINSAGYDWNFGSQYPDIFKDSVRIALSGTGQHQAAGSTRGAFFKVAMVNGNRFEGPVRIETGTAYSGDIHIGSYGNAEFLDNVDISEFRSPAWLTFFNSTFRGANQSRFLTNSVPGMRLLLKNNCLFEGPISFKVPRFSSDYTTFMKPTVIWKTGMDDDSSIGGNLFHERVQFKNTASTGKLFLLSGEDKLIDKVIPQ